MNLVSQSILAKLLATENITVNQTKSHTAYFDIQHRVLNLPLWDVQPFVYEMLVSHEVGHALYTPLEGWHDSIVDLKIPRSIINVVEDARIEKLVKSRYPGMVNTFQKAYAWMAKEDFFKIGNRPLKSFNLIDRINIHFKLGADLRVPFTTAEKPFVKMVEGVETFADVVRVSKAIQEFWKANKETVRKQIINIPQIPNQDQELVAGDSDMDNDTDDMSLSNDSSSESEKGTASGSSAPADDTSIPDEASKESDTNDSEVVSGESEESELSKDATNAPEAPSGNGGSGAEAPSENTEDDSDVEFDDSEGSSTDDALRQNEGSMLSTMRGGTVVKEFPRNYLEHIVRGYKEYYKSANRRFRSRYSKSAVEIERECDDEFKKFMNETNRVVSYLAKEFEQKKAAYQYSRAKVSNSGVLNTGVLHRYKFSEDLFKRVTTLADAKSHAMIITIDMSGSMGNVIKDVLRQALNLAIFCRRVNIPFEMYTFTTGYNAVPDQKHLKMLDGMLDPRSLVMNQLFSTKMSKKEYEHALKEVFRLSCGGYSSYDDMGSTPTAETFAALRYLIEDLKRNTRCERIINTVLTDGDPNSPTINASYRQSGMIFQYSPTKFVECGTSSNTLVQKMLESIRDRVPGVVNLGYFIGGGYEYNTAIMKACGGDYKKHEAMKKMSRQQGGASIENALGYDQYIVMRAANMQIDDDEFSTEASVDKRSITKEFMKYTSGRRTSRVLLDKFIKAIA